jgi:hypothetical protein
MVEKLPRIGDRVNVAGRDGAYFVLTVNEEARTVSLLPHVDGRVLDNVSVDTLTMLPRPD